MSTSIPASGCGGVSSYSLDLDRRQFTKVLGAGLLITVSSSKVFARPPEQNGSGIPLGDRVHIGKDGIVTVMTGKVDVGQGSRTELTQVAAEEMKVTINRIRLIMGDTALCPDDGPTGSSTTTPRTVPRVRSACAAAREILVGIAAEQWSCDRSLLIVQDGAVVHTGTGRSATYSELAGTENLKTMNTEAEEYKAAVTPVSEWVVMGQPVHRLTGEAIVTGAQLYPSDIRRPGMLYGKVLHPPAYGASLIAIDLAPAESMPGVTAVREGDFIGVTAPASHLADVAVQRLAGTAQWNTTPQPSHTAVVDYLRTHASSEKKIVQETGSVQEGLKNAARTLQASYSLAHIQHAPMEPRAAVAEWTDGSVTVWAGTADPFPVRKTLALELQVPENHIRVIVPDTGGHFCGKHAGEAAIQAAKLSRVAGKPVLIRWTREEEFTWAYFRKAGIIDVRGALDASGRILAWDWNTLNSGASAIAVPYDIPHILVQTQSSSAPVREGSYRAVAAPANLFARESFMDELAHLAERDPVAFRKSHINDDRLRAVVDAAVQRFQWDTFTSSMMEHRGKGFACGIEKGSYVATCVEVKVDRKQGNIHVVRVCQAFECGAVINPANLKIQVEGSIVMGMGGALWEEMLYDNGRILNAGFQNYRVPRFSDVPDLEIILLDRPDLPSTGAGETPMITIAPAIANAVFDATGVRVRSMPIKGEYVKA